MHILYCHRLDEPVKDGIRAWGANGETIRVFRTRWVDDIALADFVRHDGIDYNLKQIKPIGRRRGLELRAVAR